MSPLLRVSLCCGLAAVSFCGARPDGTVRSGKVVLSATVGIDGLPAIVAGNYLGLGREAARIDVWFRSATSTVTLHVNELRLQDEGGRSMTLTPEMTKVLTRLNQWYGLASSEDDPITHEQLRVATVSDGSVSRIQTIFDDAIGRAIFTSEKWLVPETGGEATMDSELRLAEIKDPRWSTVQDLAKLVGQPKAVGDLYARSEAEVADVDRHGLIKNALGRYRLKMNGAEKEIGRAIETVVQNSAPTYTHDPDLQFALIASQAWSGRYVGQWHTHSPHQGKDQWMGGDVPSFEDMQNALAAGQYLTLSFQPDGFDLYDASAMVDAGKVDLSRLQVIRYRSAAWREHFEKQRVLLTRAH
ncbi:MAG: hypothetical protein ABI672_06180 [Vicinamibacteria bacterium]